MAEATIEATPGPVRPPAAALADEADLVARAQRDPRDFAPLYDRYADPVYRYCHRRLGDPDAAADATALVFAKAIAALPRYREGSFRSWLFAIAHNAIVDDFRRRADRREAPLADAADIVDGSRDGAPEAAALAADERRILFGALAQLSNDQRRIVELRLSGLTGAEIAVVLGRSLGAIKIAQRRAYANLRALLAPETEADPSGAPR